MVGFLPSYPDRPFVLYREKPFAHRRLICFHHAAGSASNFRSWVNLIPDDTELLAIQLAGRDNRASEPFSQSINETADEIVTALGQLRFLPWVAVGHSLGGCIAYECIRRIEGSRLAASGLVLAAARAPNRRPESKLLHQMFDEELVASLQHFSGTPAAILENPEALQFFLPRIRADFRLSETYFLEEPHRLTVPVLYLRARDDTVVSDVDVKAWAEFTSAAFELSERDGDHFFPHSDPRGTVSVVTDWMNRILPTTAAGTACQSQ